LFSPSVSTAPTTRDQFPPLYSCHSRLRQAAAEILPDNLDLSNFDVNVSEDVQWKALMQRVGDRLSEIGKAVQAAGSETDAVLAEWKEAKEKTSIAALFDRIVHDTGYEEYVKAESDVNNDRWENVMELRRLAYDFQEKGMTDFLQNLALVLMRVGRLDEAAEKLESSLRRAIEAADPARALRARLALTRLHRESWHGDAARAVLDQQDAIILPSNFEGYPIVVMEAMALGVVPIVSRLRNITVGRRYVPFRPSAHQVG
jgi:glycosyltransferase involved in cell wall biosynthesis